MRIRRTALICVLLLSGVVLIVWMHSGIRPMVTIPTDRRVIDLDFRPKAHQLAICEVAHDLEKNAFAVVDFRLNPPFHSISYHGNAHHCDWSHDGSRLTLSSGWWDISCIDADSYDLRWSAKLPDVNGLSPASVGNEAVAIFTQGPIGNFAPTPASQPILISRDIQQTFATTGFPFCMTTSENAGDTYVAVSYQFEPRIEVGRFVRDEFNMLRYLAEVVIPTEDSTFVRYGPGAKTIVALSADRLRLLDSKSGVVLQSLEVERSSHVDETLFQPLSVSRNGLIAVAESGRVVVRRMEDLSSVMIVPGYSPSIAISDTGQLLAISKSGPYRVEVFAIESK